MQATCVRANLLVVAAQGHAAVAGTRGFWHVRAPAPRLGSTPKCDQMLFICSAEPRGLCGDPRIFADLTTNFGRAAGGRGVGILVCNAQALSSASVLGIL